MSDSENLFESRRAKAAFRESEERLIFAPFVPPLAIVPRHRLILRSDRNGPRPGVTSRQPENSSLRMQEEGIVFEAQVSNTEGG